MAILPDKTKNVLKNAIYNLIDDVTINTQITYKQHKTGTYDPEEQTYSSGTWTDFKPLNAIKTFFTDFERYTSEGEVELGDVRFIINREDIRNSPSPADLIIETKDQSGVTYAVIKVAADPLSIAYIFHCRRP